eukprot:15480860-Alexandrium_andersonii.AAC.1
MARPEGREEQDEQSTQVRVCGVASSRLRMVTGEEGTCISHTCVSHLNTYLRNAGRAMRQARQITAKHELLCT